MAERPVHWYEGMFLGPQHLQAAQRYEASQRHKFAHAAVHHHWGLQSLDLNDLALRNYRFEVHSLRAFLRDGTLIDVPADGPLPALELRAALEKDPLLTVYLVLPSYHSHQANCAESGETGNVRFQVDLQETEDENTGTDPQKIGFRLLNVKLIAATDEEPPGYDALPIAKISKSEEGDPKPRVDDKYIPPVIDCEAWPILQIGILRSIYDRIGPKINLLSEQVDAHGIGLASQAAEDILIIGQLRVLNEAYAVLGVLAFAPGVHPLQVYLELCRIVGQLTIFGGAGGPLTNPEVSGAPVSPGAAYRPPELPRYDHDNLGHCFWTVKKYIDALLNRIIDPEWQARVFRGVGVRMQVALEPVWLEASWEMYVGIEAIEGRLPAEQCVRLFSSEGELDMKIGSSDRVERIFAHGEAGLLFTHKTQPRSLPVRANLTYFQVDRNSQRNEWEHARRSMTLAVRVNERKLLGDIDGKDSIVIKSENRQVRVRLTLYITKPEKGS